MPTAPSTPDAPAPSPPKPGALLFLLVFAAAVGLLVSLVAWGFLELVHVVQTWVFTDIPRDLGYANGPPLWYYVVVLGLAGLPIAFAIVRLPGRGGHIPAEGLKVGGDPVLPADVPGIMLAALATIGLGLVLGPEAPLIAVGAGLGLFAIRSVKRDTPAQAQTVIAASGSFAAISMLFGSPIIAAVLLLEALGLDREKLPVVLLPGLLAAGIGSLVSIGLGSVTGLSTSAYALQPLSLPALATPTIPDFAWTIPLAIAVGVVAVATQQLGLRTNTVVMRRAFVLLPVAGMVVAGLAIAFHGISGKSVDNVLFDGQDQLPVLISEAGSWSIAALLLLCAFKSLAWGVSLGSFRGGPTFPAMFIGAAGGIVASHLPGFDLTAAVGVGIGAGVAGMLRLPLSAVVIGTLLVSKSGVGSGPVIIVGVVVTYLTAVACDRALARAAARRAPRGAGSDAVPAPAPSAPA